MACRSMRGLKKYSCRRNSPHGAVNNKNTDVSPAKAGTQRRWIPAFAGMTDPPHVPHDLFRNRPRLHLLAARLGLGQEGPVLRYALRLAARHGSRRALPDLLALHGAG